MELTAYVTIKLKLKTTPAKDADYVSDHFFSELDYEVTSKTRGVKIEDQEIMDCGLL
jgi:hypothetical protein